MSQLVSIGLVLGALAIPASAFAASIPTGEQFVAAHTDRVRTDDIGSTVLVPADTAQPWLRFAEPRVF
ncbi:hypothetical protein RHODGE_RHODGE_04339 [Rhodoplanes serenus]|uniref:Uncharacterized protein n=1 Tax=Rhodoplanes serenus TaxID=200615 RepID=A0A447D0R6_9BRAD|nr:hypothetical protein [Rhodoplanes serenus]MBI5112605.1 hypothetical protein [Rhodovulum sp.]VCU11133.1 hypothetical protein RHODGE_RHODGE_04339 [Rhodoplanes serenus]